MVTGFIIALVAMGLPMIGITVSLYLGGAILLAAFLLLAYGFWKWEKAKRWGDAARVSTLWMLGIIYFALVGWQIFSQYRKGHPAPTLTAIKEMPASPQTTLPLANPNLQNLEPRKNTPERRKQIRKTASSASNPSLPPTASQQPASPGSIVQSNSGGINVQQGTTAENSPIINSPITVGDVPKKISQADMPGIVHFFSDAKVKCKISIHADQYSGAVPLPDDFYQALKDGGWVMEEPGVSRYMGLHTPGKLFQGAIITVNGDPLSPGQTFYVNNTEPLFYVGTILRGLKIPLILMRNQKQPADMISVDFEGGFPN